MKEKQDKYNYNYLYLYVATLVIGSSHSGYGFSCFNPLMETFNVLFGWTKEESNFFCGIITIMVPGGAFIGAFIAGPFISSGRRFTIFVYSAFIIIGSFINLNLNIYCLIIGRLIQGIGVGLSSVVVTLFIKEISPISISGFLCSFHQITNVVIMLVPMFLSSLIPNTEIEIKQSQLWRFMFFLPILLSSLQIFLFIFIFRSETPKFLMMQGKEDEAKRQLSKIYKNPKEIEEIIQTLRIAISESSQNSRGVGCTELVGPSYRCQLIVGNLVSFFQQATGINVVVFYSSTIYSDGGRHDPSIPNMLTAIFNVTFSFMSSVLVDRLGRRKLFIIGSFIIGNLMLIIGFFYEKDCYTLKVVCLLLFIAAFAVSHGPLCWLYIPEILPSSGISIATSFNFLCTIAIGFVTPYGINVLKGLYFEIFAVSMFICIIFCLFCVPETRRMDENEIKKLFTASDSEVKGNGSMKKMETIPSKEKVN